MNVNRGQERGGGSDDVQRRVGRLVDDPVNGRRVGDVGVRGDEGRVEVVASLCDLEAVGLLFNERRERSVQRRTLWV